MPARCGPLRTAGGDPQVGRTPKVYEPTETDIRISIPRRRHDVLADILLEAVLTEGEDETAREAALRAARRRGEQAGATERNRVRPVRLGPERALTLASGLLEQDGFERPGKRLPAWRCVTAPSIRWRRPAAG